MKALIIFCLILFGPQLDCIAQNTAIPGSGVDDFLSAILSEVNSWDIDKCPDLSADRELTEKEQEKLTRCLTILATISTLEEMEKHRILTLYLGKVLGHRDALSLLRERALDSKLPDHFRAESMFAIHRIMSLKSIEILVEILEHSREDHQFFYNTLYAVQKMVGRQCALHSQDRSDAKTPKEISECYRKWWEENREGYQFVNGLKNTKYRTVSSW